MEQAYGIKKVALRTCLISACAYVGVGYGQGESFFHNCQEMKCWNHVTFIITGIPHILLASVKSATFNFPARYEYLMIKSSYKLRKYI